MTSETKFSLRSQFFDLAGNSYHALVAGDDSAPLLLFLHGFPEYCGAWQDVMPLLADRWFCVAPDQRGYGQSWRPEGTEHYETRHLVADVSGMLDHFGGGRAAAVIGHDWGASVAYATAIRFPEKLGSLVIANGVHPAPFQAALAKGGAQTAASQYISWLRTPGSEAALSKDNFAAMFSLFSAQMDMGWLTAGKEAEYKAAWKNEAGVRAMVNWYRASPLVVAQPDKPLPQEEIPAWPREHLRIRMPHLLLWGEADTALLPETKEGLSEYCDDLTEVVFPNEDHWILHQNPTRVALEIKRFLDR